MSQIILNICLAISMVGLGHSKVDSSKDFTLPKESECGRNNVNRIVGGEQAKAHAWPWQVALYERPVWADNNDTWTFICGGSIINQRYILCAAHCVSSWGEITQAKNLKIMGGAHNRTKVDGKWFNVNKIFVHHKYNDTTMQYDISLLRLETPIEFTKSNRTMGPICVANPFSLGKENLVNKSAVVTGWGTEQPMGDVTHCLMQVSVPIVSHDKCVKAYDNESITPLNICAGYAEGKKDSCQGDSGGPLAIRLRNCWIQVGIVSWGRSCAEPDAYGVYTRVSVHYSWIIETLTREKKTPHYV